MIINNPTPQHILSTIFPYLQTSAHYAHYIQKNIEALPDKDLDNIFSQALSAADLSVQTVVEVALLAHFPHLAFFGEEHEKTYNTRYFSNISWHEERPDLHESNNYLLLLDPIDGTRYFLDGHENFQIIFSILTPKGFEAALLISPARNEFYYALRNQGVFHGKDLTEGFASAVPYQPPAFSKKILFSSKVGTKNPKKLEPYEHFTTLERYSATAPCAMGNDIFLGALAAMVYGSVSYIDGGALTFVAQEAGFTVTDFDGQPLTEPGRTKSLKTSPAIIARTPELADAIRQSELFLL
jgi:myo-inositol-1(or 4)-monophosphatase